MIKSYVLLMRPHQWIKNIIIFVPLISSQDYQLTSFLICLLGWLIFSFISSCGYVVNDIFDKKSDQKHNEKKYRPIASEKIDISTALFLSLCVFLISIIIAFVLDIYFAFILILYLFLSILYSFFLKKIIVIDLILISYLFLFRIISGSVLIDVQTSIYLLLFSQLFFFSLAGIKRISEITIYTNDNNLPGRAYKKTNIYLVKLLSLLSFILSLTILVFYISSNNAINIYTNSKLLYLMCPIITFWFYRMINLASKKKIKGDPIIFAIKDKISLFILFISVIIVYLSI